MLICGFYFDGWHMKDLLPSELTKDAFLGGIEVAFSQDPNANTVDLVREVFELLAR